MWRYIWLMYQAYIRYIRRSAVGLFCSFSFCAHKLRWNRSRQYFECGEGVRCIEPGDKDGPNIWQEQIQIYDYDTNYHTCTYASALFIMTVRSYENYVSYDTDVHMTSCEWYIWYKHDVIRIMRTWFSFKLHSTVLREIFYVKLREIVWNCKREL